MLAGNEAMVATRQAKQAEVQQALVAAQAAVAALADEKLKDSATRVASAWQALAHDVAGRAVTGPQSFGRHTVLIDEQLMLLEDIANTSGIVFEEDPAAYFLQAAMLRTLPAATEALGQMRARGSALLTRGEASAEDKARFDALVQQFQRAQVDSQRLLARMGQHDEGLRSLLASTISDAQASSVSAMQLVEAQILQADKLSYAPVAYFAATTRTIDDQFKLIDAGFRQLDRQLTRQAEAARTRLAALAVGLLAMASLAGWVIWVATDATTEAVASALGLAQAVAAGDLRTKLHPPGRDEIAQMLQALVAMNRGLAGVVSGVRQNAESVASASAQIAQGNLDLSSRTEQQAAALEQTAATRDQLGSTVRSTADHAREASGLAPGATTVAHSAAAPPSARSSRR